MRYAAFLRGLNVGAHNRVRMEPLRNALTDAGLRDVATYLQSGNVMISNGGDETPDALLGRLQIGLAAFGLQVQAVLRSVDEMEAVVAANPFGPDDADDSHRFVTFLGPGLESPPALAPRSARGDFEILRATTTEVYSVARLVGERYGAPNGPIEGKLKVAATTRNWAVVQAVAGLLRG